MGNPMEPVKMDTSRGRPELNRMTTDQLISRLQDPYRREDTLALISKRTATEENLAQKVWNSPNTMYILLKEVVAVYRCLEQKTLNMADSVRVCNAIALIQCVASNPETRMPFLKAKIPVYLYPFLNTKNSERPFEYLRLMSLGVLGVLVKVEDQNSSPQIVHFLLETEVFPLCLRCMDAGAEMSKTVSTFILAKILMQEEGLLYCCGYAERFYSVTCLLGKLVNNIGEISAPKQLKNIIRCYFRLSLVKRACEALCGCFPEKLRGSELTSFIEDDPTTLKFLEQVLKNLASVQNSTRKMDRDVKNNSN